MTIRSISRVEWCPHCRENTSQRRLIIKKKRDTVALCRKCLKEVKDVQVTDGT